MAKDTARPKPDCAQVTLYRSHLLHTNPTICAGNKWGSEREGKNKGICLPSTLRLKSGKENRNLFFPLLVSVPVGGI